MAGALPSQARMSSEKLALAIRAKRGKLTLRQASEACGVDYTILSRIENQLTLPDLMTFIRVYLWLGVPVEFFLEFGASPGDAASKLEVPEEQAQAA